MEVELLRKQGYQIRVTHFRYTPESAATVRFQGMRVWREAMTPMHELRASFELDQANQEADTNYMDSHGGATKIELKTPEGVEFQSEAHCSIHDPYNKRKGVKITLSRIFNKLCEHYKINKHAVKEAVRQFAYLPASGLVDLQDDLALAQGCSSVIVQV
jgi:hypothetical protein